MPCVVRGVTQNSSSRHSWRPKKCGSEPTGLCLCACFVHPFSCPAMRCVCRFLGTCPGLCGAGAETGRQKDHRNELRTGRPAVLEGLRVHLRALLAGRRIWNGYLHHWRRDLLAASVLHIIALAVRGGAQKRVWWAFRNRNGQPVPARRSPLGGYLRIFHCPMAEGDCCLWSGESSFMRIYSNVIQGMRVGFSLV
jgi:hypothetical protein